MCIKYLDYIINRLNDKDSEHHNKLATYYLDKMLSLEENSDGNIHINYYLYLFKLKIF